MAEAVEFWARLSIRKPEDNAGKGLVRVRVADGKQIFDLNGEPCTSISGSVLTRERRNDASSSLKKDSRLRPELESPSCIVIGVPGSEPIVVMRGSNSSDRLVPSVFALGD